MDGGMSFEQRSAAVEQACRALAGVDGDLWAASGAELGRFASQLDELGTRVDAARVDLLREAVDRAEAGSGRSGAHAWLLDHSPSLRAGGSARVVRLAETAHDERYAALVAAVRQARVPLVTAAVVVEEFERLGPRLAEGAEGPVLDGLIDVASWGRPKDVRGLRDRLVAKYGAAGEFQGEHDRLCERRSLSQAFSDGFGLFEYTMVVDAEARATIEAAVQGLSAPRPADEEPDRRASGQRRMDALLEVVRRGVGSADGVATTPKAELFVTVSLQDLVARSNAATVFGSGEAGTLIGPETARRIACDAGIVPVVLGKDGQVLDLGRRFRLFTSAQLRALWLRDGGCTFPNCTVPASWCDGHHLRHWVDGGATDLGNAALLCGRHHTIVHRKGYYGELIDGHVRWLLVPGSYDRWLADRQAASAGRAAVVGERPAVRTYDVWGELEIASGSQPSPPWRP
ncbi:HNH endonuclease signature motif containing protein [Pedococcus bigeumensis]|uniref:HNH endonuclease n=1 Tax=Pedococcus bigeumensis TaxID=433644 RepID=A0A502D441_9MICO|nr:HNH endonuclease signature motif containing protein [Pedococcus bigeumensis]TPG19159.1 HNH endonuclease [Pedococcus bigeumensis]